MRIYEGTVYEDPSSSPGGEFESLICINGIVIKVYGKTYDECEANIKTIIDCFLP